MRADICQIIMLSVFCVLVCSETRYTTELLLTGTHWSQKPTRAVGEEHLEKRKKKKKQKTTSMHIEVPSPTADMAAIGSDRAFVDVYDCAGVKVTTLDELSKVKYGCLWEGRISYYIHQGRTAVENLTNIINKNETYTKNYNAYVKAIQTSILSEFGEWFFHKKGSDFYRCGAKKESNLYKCEGVKFAPGKDNLCSSTIGTVKNAFIENSNKTAAAKSMSDFFERNITDKDLGFVSSNQNINLNDKSHCTFKVQNTTLPKAGQLLPNPMTGITVQNLTDIASLIATAEASLGKLSPLDISDIMTPVAIFITIGQQVENINVEGAKLKKIEKKQREMMILNIVISLVGVFTVFLGAVEAALAEVVLAAIQIGADFAIAGTINKSDAKNIILGSILEILGGFAAGKVLKEVATGFRFSKVAGFDKKMLQFDAVKSTANTMYGLSFNS